MKIKGFLVENNQTIMTGGGFANGYVVIPEGNPIWGLDYNSELIEGLSIHGGITFSEKVDEDMLNHETFGSDLTMEDLGSWVIGFDTRHSGDTLEKWPQSKVEREVVKLIKQVENLVIV